MREEQPDIRNRNYRVTIQEAQRTRIVVHVAAVNALGAYGESPNVTAFTVNVAAYIQRRSALRGGPWTVSVAPAACVIIEISDADQETRHAYACLEELFAERARARGWPPGELPEEAVLRLAPELRADGTRARDEA